MENRTNKLLEDLDFVISYTDKDKVVEILTKHLTMSYSAGLTDCLIEKNLSEWKDHNRNKKQS